MRTTVTIDDDLLAAAKQLAAADNRTLGSVVEDALREMLARHRRQREDPAKAALPTFGDPDARPLVDILDRDALADALDDGHLR